MIKWSFSGLKQFINCPRQYNEVKIKGNFQTEETEQIRYGKEVHKALEDYVREGKPLLKNYQRFQKFVDPILALGGTAYAEHEMALREDHTPCGFKDEDYWVRGIVDLLVIKGDTAYIIDYKTGSNRYPDSTQLQLMALLVFAHFSEVNHAKGCLMFVVHDSFVFKEYRRDQTDALWVKFTNDLARLKISFTNDTWPPNPKPLCGWCPVKTCEFYKQK